MDVEPKAWHVAQLPDGTEVLVPMFAEIADGVIKLDLTEVSWVPNPDGSVSNRERIVIQPWGSTSHSNRRHRE